LNEINDLTKSLRNHYEIYLSVHTRIKRMSTIWKYELNHDGMGHINLAIPGPAKIIHFGHQRGQMCVWAEVEPGRPDQQVQLTIVGTGHDVPPNSKHHGTVFEGPFVWHLYEEEHELVHAT
jgi:hypothetical protein